MALNDDNDFQQPFHDYEEDDDSDDDEIPLARRLPKKQRVEKTSSESNNEQPDDNDDDLDDFILSKRGSKRPRAAAHDAHINGNGSLPKRPKKESTAVTASPTKINTPTSRVTKRGTKRSANRKPKREPKREPKQEDLSDDDDAPIRPAAVKQESKSFAAASSSDDPWWKKQEDARKKGIKWTTLVHNAVIFPPEYVAHGVKMRYDEKPVELTPEAEEIATFYAAKLETDYVQKSTFRCNFFKDFRRVLKGSPAYDVIEELELCDFTPIHRHLEKLKAAKKEVPLAERKRRREEEQEACKKYTVAYIDGREEKVGNYRVEPPGLFLGRGEHPKMGMVKARIYPEDITINIDKMENVPECPIPGHKWGQIVHKRDVTWLCGWKDTITGGSKYVWLAAGSAFKGMSDHAKFEKSRKLANYIERIRRDYRAGWKEKSKEVRQRSVAMYLIDKLALRVGNEKGEDEADTVGCCSLRVEHIQFEPPHTIVFDFLGKDSIRYFNSVEVEKAVYQNLQLFCRNKNPSDEIFHRLSVTVLNEYLRSCMEGLSAKVFRTYNASFTLDRLLQETPRTQDLNQKLVFYNKQNKEVAILCNHQRALPKAHGAQMEKMNKKLAETKQWLTELKRGRTYLRKAKGEKPTVELTQMMPVKPEYTEGMTDQQRGAERKRAADAPKIPTKRTKNMQQVETAIKAVAERLAKLEADMQTKEDLKTVALGTSKINYLDPRITVAWCKKHNVPIEKIFAKTLLVKFAWAMETSENFRF